MAQKKAGAAAAPAGAAPAPAPAPQPAAAPAPPPRRGRRRPVAALVAAAGVLAALALRRRAVAPPPPQAAAPGATSSSSSGPPPGELAAFLLARLGPEPSPSAAGLAPLFAWASARGASLAGVAPATFGGPPPLRGLAAARAFAPGEEVASLPLAAALSAATFTAFGPGLRAALAGSAHPAAGWLTQTVVLHELLRCTAGVDAGDWCLYLATLPRSFPDLPAFYHDGADAAGAADGDGGGSGGGGGGGGGRPLWTRLRALSTLVRSQRAELAAVRPDVLRALGSLHARRAPPRGAAQRAADASAAASLASLAASPPLAAAACAWAWAVALTRSLEQPAGAFGFRAAEDLHGLSASAPVLMPVLDLLNHGEANAAGGGGGGGANAAVVTDGGGGGGGAVIRLVAGASGVAAGEELRFPYGNPVAEAAADPAGRDVACADQWLSHYGFAPPASSAAEAAAERAAADAAAAEGGAAAAGAAAAGLGPPTVRDCWGVRLTARALASVVADAASGRRAADFRRRGEPPPARPGLEAAFGARLAARGQPAAVDHVFDANGTLWVGLLHFVAAAAWMDDGAERGGGAEWGLHPGSNHSVRAAEASPGVWSLLAHALSAAAHPLGRELAAARGAGGGEHGGGGEGPAVRAVAAGALRAAARATAAASGVADRLAKEIKQRAEEAAGGGGAAAAAGRKA